MGIKTYLKRGLIFITKGTPVVNLTVPVVQIQKGYALEGRRIVITGGGRGLGYAIAQKVASEGAQVLLIGRNEDNLRKAKSELGEKCEYTVFDVSDINKIDSFVNSITSKYGEYDSFVFNAGVSLHEKNITDVTIDQFEKQFRINLESTYFFAKAVIEQRSVDSPKNIVIVSSERGFQADDIPYGLTKAALNSLTRGLSRRFYKDNIRVNAVAPGVTVSDMTQKKRDDNLYHGGAVAGRWFVPEEVAEIVAFLLSDASKCVSGEIIACDAGQYINSYF